MTLVKELRQKRGLSIAAMSFETRVNATTLSLLERRKVVPSSRVREAVSSFLGISDTQAFDGEGFAV